MNSNITAGRSENKLSHLFRNLGQPVRLQILLAIGEGEACVCHMEALLGYRQAYISQHLMALREAGVLKTRREGRYIYYRLCDPRILDLLRYGMQIAGEGSSKAGRFRMENVAEGCLCPSCQGGP